ncbi:MAG: twin transmembrane helix small protein [Gammaproteobacteria bacterium]
MFIKIFVVIVLLVIIGSLASAAFFLVKDRSDSNRTVRALTWRIGLSISLFLFLLLASYMGWIQPHGVLPPAAN